MGIDLILLAGWLSIGLVWLLAAWLSLHKTGKTWEAVLAIILAVVSGPCGIFFFIYWSWRTHGPTAPPTAEEVRRAREGQLMWFREGWDRNELSVPQLIQFSKLLEEEKRPDEALAVIDRAVSFQPGNPEIWRLKGKLHWRLGQTADEAESYTKAEELGR